MIEPQKRGPYRPSQSVIRAIGLIALVAVALALVLVFRFWPSRKSAEPEEAAPVVSVRVVKASRQTVTSETTALGTIWPKQQATISPKISAPIARMALLKNKPVHEGETIAVLESRDLASQRTEAAAAVEEARLSLRSLRQGTIPQSSAQAEKELRDARANLDATRAVYERRRELYQRDGIAKKDLEAAQLALTTAETQFQVAERTAGLRTSVLNPSEIGLAESKVKQAEERLATLTTQVGYATIRAPFSGIITDQFQYQGEFVAAGTKLVNLADLSKVIVKAPFPDSIVAELKTGDSASIKPADAPEETAEGRVSLISRATDPSNRTVEVWIDLPNKSGRLRSGAAAEVTISTRTSMNALVVPLAAVTFSSPNSANGTVMIVDSQSVAHEKKVTTGVRTSEGLIQILSGIEEGETVVVEGNYSLPDGSKVQVGEAEKDEDDDNKGKKEEKEEKPGGKP
jgi:HlyD family secretion protein